MVEATAPQRRVMSSASTKTRPGAISPTDSGRATAHRNDARVLAILGLRRECRTMTGDAKSAANSIKALLRPRPLYEPAYKIFAQGRREIHRDTFRQDQNWPFGNPVDAVHPGKRLRLHDGEGPDICAAGDQGIAETDDVCEVRVDPVQRGGQPDARRTVVKPRADADAQARWVGRDEGFGDPVEPLGADHRTAHAARISGKARGIETQRGPDP